MLLIIGTVLIVLGVLSRLYSLSVYRRVTETATRPVEPSILPATPWLTVQSDQSALKVIVVTTYVSVVLGMVLFLIGVL
jgi:hypothetical protein